MSKLANTKLPSSKETDKVHKHYTNINWRDVQIKNVVNNEDMSRLRAPWQNGPYKN